MSQVQAKKIAEPTRKDSRTTVPPQTPYRFTDWACI